MKTKKLLFLSALCLFMSASFIACSDDDDDDKNDGTPTEVVSAITFGDTNPAASKISGTVNWVAPSSVSDITKYVIYLSSDGKGKDEKLGEVSVENNKFVIPEGTTYHPYILVIAANSKGESNKIASLKIGDFIATPGLYFLNSGKMDSNNASLYFYNLSESKMYDELFLSKNGRGLGDTGNDMVIYGNKMYIAVYNSNTIEVTDLSGNSIKQIKPTGQPRFLTFYEGKVYATLYNGYVARLDTASLEIDATAKVGRNPEQIVVANEKLYVANSGGLDYNTEVGYDKTVSIVDIASFSETQKLEVVINPCNMVTDNQGDVYVVSMGNYTDIPNTLQRIDTQKDEVTTIEVANATEMASVGDKIYMIYSQYDANWNQVISFISYDAINERVISENFLEDPSIVAKPYKICADKTTGTIYISSSDYKTNGDFYAFDANGKYLNKWGAGLNPVKVIAVNP